MHACPTLGHYVEAGGGGGGEGKRNGMNTGAKRPGVVLLCFDMARGTRAGESAGTAVRLRCALHVYLMGYTIRMNRSQSRHVTFPLAPSFAPSHRSLPRSLPLSLPSLLPIAPSLAPSLAPSVPRSLPPSLPPSLLPSLARRNENRSHHTIRYDMLSGTTHSLTHSLTTKPPSRATQQGNAAAQRNATQRNATQRNATQRRARADCQCCVRGVRGCGRGVRAWPCTRRAVPVAVRERRVRYGGIRVGHEAVTRGRRQGKTRREAEHIIRYDTI